MIHYSPSGKQRDIISTEEFEKDMSRQGVKILLETEAGSFCVKRPTSELGVSIVQTSSPQTSILQHSIQTSSPQTSILQHSALSSSSRDISVQPSFIKDRDRDRARIVNFIGGPGIGKSIISALVFAALKVAGHTTEYVQEYAKQLVWTKDFDTLNNQYYVTNHQYNLLKMIETKVKYIVTDGPLCHGLYYNIYNPHNTSNTNKTQDYILKSHFSFSNINIFLVRGNYAYEQEGRLQTEQEAKEIDIVLKHSLRAAKIEFTEFPSLATPENIGKIVEFIVGGMNTEK